ncbi:outer membrane lipid asymmetry maintenance protein MlaD [Nioella sediminis]|jgi:phospholipid/cholesterol/gamma-HCH transport system substrate-binding protein|uniref:outer membrane lipid asymmetry maintenance protein MlaD n=1 Tax=Nioella sediminis TaxID=1912092 RepID=UPI0008FD271E|nr:outer membrane lipid asymmetry maintenance protein MlaD [Nioella sediminis]TBX27777.1 ABC transporter substrate-binding protein [Roseovarius sp. JS7-11]
MSENATEVLVGGVVLAAAIGFFVYAGQVTGFESGGDSYPLSASFRSADGIGVGTDVRLAGVRVGSVTALDLNPVTFRADVDFTVAGGIEIPDDTQAVIASEGLLGGNFLELVPGGSAFNLAPGDEVYETQSAVSLTTLILRAVGGGDE